MTRYWFANWLFIVLNVVSAATATHVAAFIYIAPSGVKLVCFDNFHAYTPMYARLHDV